MNPVEFFQETFILKDGWLETKRLNVDATLQLHLWFGLDHKHHFDNGSIDKKERVFFGQSNAL